MRSTGAATGNISRISKKTIWRWLGAAVGIAIVAAACVTLIRLLHDIEPAKVLAALQATSWQTIAVAALFIAASYGTLTFYDYFALRTIGRHDVPYRVAAFAGFTSYSIGHNLGATVFTAGAVRYRIYSAWNLDLLEVAKIAFVTGLTFWLGNAFLLGIGIAYEPQAASAINRLPPWLNRAIGLAGLAVIAGYLLWLVPRPRAIGRNGWQVVLPSARLTVVQIAIGVLDLGLAALAMYTLLPNEPGIEPMPFLVTFVAATLLGFLSHAPGSIGVLDAAILVSLPAFEKEQLLAALLIYRALYFLLPFAVALLLLGLRELWLAARRKPDASGGL